jgi:hypothetical protein
MDLHTAENPQGTLSHSDMYKCLLDIRVWGVNNNDPAMAWNRRRWAQKAAEIISKTNKALVTAVAAEKKGRGLFETLASFVSPAYRVRKIALEKGSLRSAGHAIVEGLLAAGKTIEETADICWLTSFGGIGVPVTAVRIHAPFIVLLAHLSLVRRGHSILPSRRQREALAHSARPGSGQQHQIRQAP